MGHLAIVEAVRSPLMVDHGPGTPGGTVAADLLSSVLESVLVRSRTRFDQVDEVVVCGASSGWKGVVPGAADVRSIPGTAVLEERARGGFGSLTLVAAVCARHSGPSGPTGAPPSAPEVVAEVAARSIARAVAAAEAGDFDGEIARVALAGTGGWLLERDQIGALDRERRPVPVGVGVGPVHSEDACVTSAPAPRAFGAAAVLMCAADRAIELGFRPRATVLAVVGEPSTPATAWEVQERVTSRALVRAGVLASQLDHVEIDERFAAAPEVWGRRFRVHEDLVNPRGGAMALGIPGLASGLRLVVTLLHGLRTTGGVFGLVVAHEPDGTVRAVVVERTA